MRVITANIRHRLAPTDVRRHLDLLAASAPDVIGLQEMGGRRSVLTAWAAENGYQVLMPDVPGVSGESSTPLLIRDTIPVLASGGIQATEATTVPAAAAGPRRYPPKWVTWADLPGVRIYNLHMPASLHLPKMRALATQVAEAVSDHAAGQMRVVIMGDFNTTRPLDLFDPFDGLTDTSDALGSRPTLRRRDIDRVLYSGTRALRQSTISGLSDHRARLVDLDITLEAPVTSPTDLTERVIKRARALGCTVLDYNGWDSQAKPVYQERLVSRPVTRKKADTLVAHITVTRDTGDLGADMRTLERIGLERFKSGVSYNFPINSAGEIGVGMPLEAKGTHTVNDKGVAGFSHDQNAVARAFSWIGMPGDKFTDEFQLAATRLMAAMILEGALTEDPDVVPHSLFAYKDCPTDPLRDALPKIKRDALALVKEVRNPEPAEPSRGGNIDSALDELDKAAKHAERTKQPKRLAKIRAAIESLLSIKTR